MELRKLGRTGLSVPAICLGTMNFGDEIFYNHPKDILALARAEVIQYANGIAALKQSP